MTASPATPPLAGIHLLICDDDRALCLQLLDFLQDQALAAEAVHSAEALLQRLGETPVPQVLVLDLMLPGVDGLSALRQIRKTHALPIIMLSSRGDSEDRAVGLELGADDYLAKPCLPRELLARIQAVWRRSADASPALLCLGALNLNPHSQVASLGERRLELTAAEFSVLQVLAKHAGEVVSREALTEQALHRPLEAFDRAIDVHISRLRKKLAGPDAIDIIGVRGAGYQLATA